MFKSTYIRTKIGLQLIGHEAYYLSIYLVLNFSARRADAAISLTHLVVVVVVEKVFVGESRRVRHDARRLVRDEYGRRRVRWLRRRLGGRRGRMVVRGIH